MIEAVIVGLIVVLFIAGLWWTRRAPSYLPGGLDDPARLELARFDKLGDVLPGAGELPGGEEQANSLPGDPNAGARRIGGEPAAVEANDEAWKRERERRERDGRS
jgi:hypothetical protein